MKSVVRADTGSAMLPEIVVSDPLRQELSRVWSNRKVRGWDFDEWPYGRAPELSAVISLRDQLSVRLRQFGACVIRWGPTLGDFDSATMASNLLSAIGQPVRIFQRRPFWRRLTADVTRNLGASEGVGRSSLHIDFVNAQFPPAYVALYCVRPDPLGGGASTIVQLGNIEAGLSEAARARLRENVFRDGRVHQLSHVGDDINPFSILGDDVFPVRYTSNLELQPDLGRDHQVALEELRASLATRAVSRLLASGDMLVIDQRLCAHARESLGSGQEFLVTEERRLLLQAYALA